MYLLYWCMNKSWSSLFVDSGHYQVLYVTPEYVDLGADFLLRIHQSFGKKNTQLP